MIGMRSRDVFIAERSYFLLDLCLFLVSESRWNIRFGGTWIPETKKVEFPCLCLYYKCYVFKIDCKAGYPNLY